MGAGWLTHPTEELVRRGRSGDTSAFVAQIERYRSRLEALAYVKMSAKLLRSYSVEDVLQEACLRGFRSFHSFESRGPNSFFRWISEHRARRERDGEPDPHGPPPLAEGARFREGPRLSRGAGTRSRLPGSGRPECALRREVAPPRPALEPGARFRLSLPAEAAPGRPETARARLGEARDPALRRRPQAVGEALPPQAALPLLRLSRSHPVAVLAAGLTGRRAKGPIQGGFHACGAPPEIRVGFPDRLRFPSWRDNPDEDQLRPRSPRRPPASSRAALCAGIPRPGRTRTPRPSPS